MPRNEQPRSNGSRPQDHSALATFIPGPAGLDSFAQDAARENARQLQSARAWTKPTRANVTPAGNAASATGAEYKDPGVVMNAPSAEGEFQDYKAHIIKNDLDDRLWMGTDRDVAYHKMMADREKLYHKQKWLLSLVDVRKPMNAQWLNNVAPSIMQQRSETIANEAKKAARIEWLTSYGVHNEEDVNLVYDFQTGIIPATYNVRNNDYTAGWFLKKAQRFPAATANTSSRWNAPLANQAGTVTRTATGYNTNGF